MIRHLKYQAKQCQENLDVFKAGMVTVQDESSMMVELANPKEKDYIMMCALHRGERVFTFQNFLMEQELLRREI